MNSDQKKLLTRYLWFLAALVVIVTGATAYSTYVSDREVMGDIFDKVASEIHAKNSWAATRTTGIISGGLFVAGSLVFANAWLRSNKR